MPLAKAATFPWKSHALWFYSQMVRWGQVAHTPGQRSPSPARRYRPDLYRAALKPLGVALPGANAKVEGALQAATPVGSAGASLVLGPDGFFDGADLRSRRDRRLHRWRRKSRPFRPDQFVRHSCCIAQILCVQCTQSVQSLACSTL